MGVTGSDTSEELVLAAVDGELVNRALDRLSTRHRHVLAMREGSGWTYQQIADHEGVEIGTIETLLWRARQALKREFAVVSESKEALAGFLVAGGALIKRTVFRAAHRAASVHTQSTGASGGGFRNAMAGVAVTGAAVAAAIVAPHAFSSQSASPAGAGELHRQPALRVGRAGPTGHVERNDHAGHRRSLGLERLGQRCSPVAARVVRAGPATAPAGAAPPARTRRTARGRSWAASRTAARA